MTVQVVFGPTQSQYKFGDTNRLFGVPASTPTTFLWSIEVDWDNDGSFDGQNEARFCVDMDVDRGFIETYALGDSGEKAGYEVPSVGRCTLVLDNTSGRYSAWSTAAGSLGFSVSPGRRVRIRVRKGYTGTVKDVFSGLIDDIDEDTDAKLVTLYCKDGVESLQEADVNIGVHFVALVNDLILEVLDQARWKWSVNNITPGQGYGIGLYTGSGRALRVLNELVQGYHFYAFFVSADGNLNVEGANLESLPTGYTSDKLLKSIKVTQPWENLITTGKIYVYDFKLEVNQVLWTKGEESILVEAGTTEEIFVDLTGTLLEVYATVPDQLVSGTDFVANTAADGSGTNITSSFTVSLYSFGTTAKLTITNNNVSDGYLTTFQVRGDAYLRRRSYISQDFTDYLGIGKKLISIDTPTSQDFPAARVNLNRLKNLGYPQVTKSVEVKLRGRTEQFERDINDPVYFNFNPVPVLTWSNSPLEQYNIFQISRIRHKWMSDTGQDVETTWNARHILVFNEPDLNVPVSESIHLSESETVTVV